VAADAAEVASAVAIAKARRERRETTGIGMCDQSLKFEWGVASSQFPDTKL
jgi:hypothetical protein